MSSNQVLTQNLHLPKNEGIERLINESQEIVERFINNQYSEELLYNYKTWQEENNAKNYKFISQSTKHNPFKNVDNYYYNRFKRCVYQQITSLLDPQIEKLHAYEFITENHNKNTLTRRDKEKLYNKLYQQDEYIPHFNQVLKEYENYLDEHEKPPNSFTNINKTPNPPYKLPLGPDDNSIHELEINGENLKFTLKTPDCKNPESYHDYSKTEITIKIPNHLERLIKNSEKTCNPTLRFKQEQLFLDLPVQLNTVNFPTIENRVLACDLGVKTQVTSTILEKQDEKVKQVSQPEFYNHQHKNKLHRLIEERTSTPNDHYNHDYLREKEKHLRQQIQHDVSNHLILKALAHQCETIVLENLSDLQAPKGKARTSRHISHWARGGLLDKIEYKANLVGLQVSLENPEGTSQHCPHCGSKGHTIKASNDHTQLNPGGWFTCPSCGYNADRDYIASLNVGRLHYSQKDRVSQCKPIEYISKVIHAGVSPEAFQGGSDRYHGVQPSTSETPISPFIRGENENWKWLKNNSDLGLGEAQSSVTRLAHTKKH